jgi:hypothetical protein
MEVVLARSKFIGVRTALSQVVDQYHLLAFLSITSGCKKCHLLYLLSACFVFSTVAVIIICLNIFYL